MTKLNKKLSGGLLLIALAVTSSAALADSTPAATHSVATMMACTDRSATALTMNLAEWPEIAVRQGATGSALVRIDLDRRGAVGNAAIVQSTGNHWLDQAAQRAALDQRYTPEVRDCESIGGSYLVGVDFQ